MKKVDNGTYKFNGELNKMAKLNGLTASGKGINTDKLKKDLQAAYEEKSNETKKVVKLVKLRKVRRPTIREVIKKLKKISMKVECGPTSVTRASTLKI